MRNGVIEVTSHAKTVSSSENITKEIKKGNLNIASITF